MDRASLVGHGYGIAEIGEVDGWHLTHSSCLKPEQILLLTSCRYRISVGSIASAISCISCLSASVLLPVVSSRSRYRSIKASSRRSFLVAPKSLLWSSFGPSRTRSWRVPQRQCPARQIQPKIHPIPQLRVLDMRHLRGLQSLERIQRVHDGLLDLRLIAGVKG